MKTKIFLLALVALWSSLPSPSSAESNRHEKENHHIERIENRHNDERYEHRHDTTSKIHGVIDSMPSEGREGVWVIDGLSVMVTGQTIIKAKHGDVSTGRYVEVKGYQDDKFFTASKIEIEDDYRSDSGLTHAKFYGTVREMPAKGLTGVWRINDREVLITGNTEIKEKYGRAAVGAYVEVEGNFTGTTFTVYDMEVKGANKGYNRTARNYNKIFLGKIETMPQDSVEGIWTVDGRRVTVSSDTIIDETLGKAAPGNNARIKGMRGENSLTASEITITAVTQ